MGAKENDASPLLLHFLFPELVNEKKHVSVRIERSQNNRENEGCKIRDLKKINAITVQTNWIIVPGFGKGCCSTNKVYKL